MNPIDSVANARTMHVVDSLVNARVTHMVDSLAKASTLSPYNSLAIVMGWLIAGLVGLLGAWVIYLVYTNRINLNDLVSEPPKPDGTPGGASLSRFQFLIFTFVISMSLYLIIVHNLQLISPTDPKDLFPDVPGGILAMLGISGGSYVVSKGIQSSRDTSLAETEAKVENQQPGGGQKPS